MGKEVCFVSKKHFLYGAFILSIAAILSKLLSLLYRIPFQRIAGDEGLAMYQVVYPLYSTLLILVVSGVPIVLSKMVSEQAVVGNVAEEKRIVRLTFGFISFIGFLAFILLFFGAEQLASWTGLPEVTPAIKAISFALFIVPIVAVLRGFFYGHQLMVQSGTSQVIEQFFRVITIILFAFLLVKGGFGLNEVVAGATFGTVVGAVFGAVYLIYHYGSFQRRRHTVTMNVTRTEPTLESSPISGSELFKTIVVFTFAVSISSLMIPLFGLADSFTVVNLLIAAEESVQAAKDWFGYYSRGLPFVQATTMFASALALSIVPKIAAEGRVQNNDEIKRSAHLSIKVTALMGLPAGVGLALLADDLNLILFGDRQGSFAIAMLSLSSILLTFAITTSAILQGMGKVYQPAVYLLVALVSKLILNVVLVPLYNIDGAAMATLLAYGLLTFLNGWTISRSVKGFDGWSVILGKPLLATLIMAVFVWGGDRLIRTYLPADDQGTVLIGHWVQALLIAGLIGLGVLAYFVTIFAVRGIEKHELERIPKVGVFMANLLKKWRLLS